MKKLNNIVKILLITFVIFIAIFAYNYFDSTKYEVTKIKPSLKNSKGEVCSMREPIFETSSKCRIPKQTIKLFKSICEKEIIRLYNLAKGKIETRENGLCSIARYPINDNKLYWGINTIVTYPRTGHYLGYYYPLYEVYDSFLGSNCNNFGKISFECKFDENGKCGELKITDKKDLTQFMCVDGVQY